jgi:hypothetical protein
MSDIVRVRNMQVGDWFELSRTGEVYEYHHRDLETPGGTRHWVRKQGQAKLTTLHHSCHVRVLQRAAWRE